MYTFTQVVYSMKKSRFTEGQIVSAVKAHEGGRKAEDLCRELGISLGTLYKWKSKYGGLEQSELTRLRELEAENNRLKRMYADLSLDHQLLKEVFTKKGWGLANEKKS